MTIQGLASEIARREGNRSQARIGDIREILKILCSMFHTVRVYRCLNEYADELFMKRLKAEEAEIKRKYKAKTKPRPKPKARKAGGKRKG
jgi:hypothetical protein